MNSPLVFILGQSVRLKPTQGALQKDKVGKVTSLTPTQVGITAEGELAEVRYRTSDGMPVRKVDQEFPCYQVFP